VASEYTIRPKATHPELGQALILILEISTLNAIKRDRFCDSHRQSSN